MFYDEEQALKQFERDRENEKTDISDYDEDGEWLCEFCSLPLKGGNINEICHCD